jgi:hypothetical protein
MLGRVFNKYFVCIIRGSDMVLAFIQLEDDRKLGVTKSGCGRNDIVDTGCRSKVERLTTFSNSAVAACCSSASSSCFLSAVVEDGLAILRVLLRRASGAFSPGFSRLPKVRPRFSQENSTDSKGYRERVEIRK